MRLPARRNALPALNLDWLRVRDDDDDFDDPDDLPSPHPPPPPPLPTDTSSSLSATTSTSVPSSATASTSSAAAGSKLSSPATASLGSRAIASTDLSSTSSISEPPRAAQTTVATSMASLPTSTTLSTTAAGTDADHSHHDHNDEHNGMSGGAKVGIAFGVIAGCALVVALLWALIFFRRRRRHGHRLDESPRQPPLLPFFSGRGEAPAPSKTRPHGRSRSAVANSLFAAAYRAHSAPPGADPHPGQRVPTFGAGNFASLFSGPAGVAKPAISGPRALDDDEKAAAADPKLAMPSIKAEAVPEGVDIRGSIASWFRRTSRHHPLRLNPMGGRNSLASTTDPGTPWGGNMRASRSSRFGEADGLGARLAPSPTHGAGAGAGRGVRGSVASTSHWSRSEYEARQEVGWEAGGVPPVPAVPKRAEFTRVPRAVFLREKERASRGFDG